LVNSKDKVMPGGIALTRAPLIISGNPDVKFNLLPIDIINLSGLKIKAIQINPNPKK
jgi:hypothetical protein